MKLLLRRMIRDRRLSERDAFNFNNICHDYVANCFVVDFDSRF